MPAPSKYTILFSDETEKDTKEILTNMKKFEEKKQFKFNYATFQKAGLPKFINHDLIPTTYLIDTKNLICYKFEGSCNYNSAVFKKFLLSIK